MAAPREGEAPGSADKAQTESEESRGPSSSGNREDGFRCYNCNKPGHMARDCPNPPRNPKYVDTRGTRVEDVLRDRGDRGRGRDDDRYRRDFPDRDRDREVRRRSPPRDYAPRDYPPARPPSPRRAAYPPAYGREFDPRYDSRSSYDPRGGYADPRAAYDARRPPPSYSGSGRPYDSYASSSSSSSSYDRSAYAADPRYDSRYAADSRYAHSAAYPPARGDWLDGRAAGPSAGASGSYARGGEYPPYQPRGRSRSPDRRRGASPPRDYRAASAHSRDIPVSSAGAPAASGYPPVARDYAHSHSHAAPSSYASSAAADHRR